MKKLAGLFLTCVLAMGLVACGQNAAAAWQEQYDLGVRYLSEDNYEEAILAFTAAIEIDAKRPDAYLGLADVYEAQGDLESLQAILEQGLAATSDSRMEERLAALDANSGSPDTAPQLPEVLNHTIGWAHINLDEYSYVPFCEAAAQVVSPLIAAGTAGNRDEALALTRAEDFWVGLRQALWDNLLVNNFSQELSPDGPQAQEGNICFWTQWDGDLLYFEYYYGESRTDYMVEFRPWEGTAFRCTLYLYEDGDNVEFCSGSTSGWLLNGSLTMWSQDRDGEMRLQEGAAVDELLDGPYQYKAVTNTGGFTNSYQYSNGLMLPCWQGEDGKMYSMKRTYSDGTANYIEDDSPERIDYGFIGPHMG